MSVYRKNPSMEDDGGETLNKEVIYRLRYRYSNTSHPVTLFLPYHAFFLAFKGATPISSSFSADMSCDLFFSSCAIRTDAVLWS